MHRLSMVSAGSCNPPEDDPFRLIINTLRDEYKEQKGHLQSLSVFLSSKSREIKFLHELSTGTADIHGTG